MSEGHTFSVPPVESAVTDCPNCQKVGGYLTTLFQVGVERVYYFNCTFCGKEWEENR